jgi:hypothetical protein
LIVIVPDTGPSGTPGTGKLTVFVVVLLIRCSPLTAAVPAPATRATISGSKAWPVPKPGVHTTSPDTLADWAVSSPSRC